MSVPRVTNNIFLAAHRLQIEWLCQVSGLMKSGLTAPNEVTSFNAELGLGIRTLTLIILNLTLTLTHWQVLRVCHCQTDTVIVSLSDWHCVCVTVRLTLCVSLSDWHCVCVTVTLTLSVCHCQTDTVGVSLPDWHCVCHYQTDTVSVSLSDWHCACVSLSDWHCECDSRSISVDIHHFMSQLLILLSRKGLELALGLSLLRGNSRVRVGVWARAIKLPGYSTRPVRCTSMSPTAAVDVGRQATITLKTVEWALGFTK